MSSCRYLLALRGAITSQALFPTKLTARNVSTKVAIISNAPLTIPQSQYRGLSSAAPSIGQSGLINFDQRRYKTKKRVPTKKLNAMKEEEDEEESDDDDDAEENPLLTEDLPGLNDNRTVKFEPPSIRLDSVVKVAFSVTRSKAEEAFLKGEVFVNGKRPPKKSDEIVQGDEIDLVKGINHEDPSKLDVRRVQVVEVADKASSLGRWPITLSIPEALTIPAPDE